MARIYVSIRERALTQQIKHSLAEICEYRRSISKQVRTLRTCHLTAICRFQLRANIRAWRWKAAQARVQVRQCQLELALLRLEG